MEDVLDCKIKLFYSRKSNPDLILFLVEHFLIKFLVINFYFKQRYNVRKRKRVVK